ncbi:hypothetical protein DL98DRAFT_594829 [Cadophora sp. DSE1049]|nr:hypothetical protein DL98DRAFT_594829 [Cadophora sp. DSE1049]
MRRLSQGTTALTIMPSSQLMKLNKPPEGCQIAVPIGVESGNKSNNTSQPACSDTTEQAFHISGILVQHRWYRRKKIKLQLFDNDSIPKPTSDRFENLKEQYTKSLFEFIRASSQTPRVLNIGMSLELLGSSQDDAKPWVLLQCCKSVTKKVRKFFRQRHVYADYRPAYPTVDSPVLPVLVHEEEPHKLAALDSLLEPNFYEPCSVYGDLSTMAGTLCGTEIKSRVSGTRRTATIGGLVSIVHSDGRKIVCALTAGHFLDPENGEKTDDHNDDNDAEEDCPSIFDANDSYELDISSFIGSKGASENAMLGDGALKSAVQTVEGGTSSAKIGHIFKASQDELQNRPNLDWALIIIGDENLHASNLVGSHRVATSLPKPSLGSKTQVILATARKGILFGTLFKNWSYLMLSPGGGMTRTYLLTLANGRVFQQGDSGSWVIDASTNEVYGHIVASDIFGRAYVIPLSDVFSDIKSRLSLADVFFSPPRLPSSNPRWDPKINSPPPLFLPRSALIEYFQSNNNARPQALLGAAFPESKSLNLNTISQKYLQVFCILLLIGRAECLEMFAERDDLQDSHLPFDANVQHFPACAADRDVKEFLRLFLQKQWMICAPPFRFQINKEFHDEQVLPITIKRELGQSASAALFEVEIHSEYNQLISSTQWFGEQKSNDRLKNTFILKTYLGNKAEQLYDRDVIALKNSQNRGSVPGVIGFYGSFQQQGRHNVLLEFADVGTLEHYYKTISPPKNAEDIFNFWYQMFKLVKGLTFLHGGGQTMSDDEEWHRDINPENILVSSRGGTIESEYEYRMKLVDCGTYRGETDQDERSGTGTYGAPECTTHIRLGYNGIPEKVDVWSLAAVFSEAAIWVSKSFSGLKRYRQDRIRAHQQATNSAVDCFHDGKYVLNQVLQWQRNLVLRPDDFTTSKVIFMVESMLVPEVDRGTPLEFFGRCDQIILEARRELNASRQSHHEPKVLPYRPHNRSTTSLSSTSTTKSRRLNSIRRPMERFGKSVATRATGPTLRPHMLQMSYSVDTSPTASMDTPVFCSPSIPTTPYGLASAQRTRIETPVDLPARKAISWRARKGKVEDLEGYQLLQILKGRDQAFLIDDSDTMRQHWEEVEKLFGVLAYLAKTADPDGIDLHFTTSAESHNSKKGFGPFSTTSTTKLVGIVHDRLNNQVGSLDARKKEEVNGVQSRINDLASSIDRILRPYAETLQNPKRGHGGGNRPLSLYILTDGQWPKDISPERILTTNLSKILEHKDHSQLSIEFVSFGNDKQALRKIENMAHDPELMDIVDTTPCNGNIWKMILGHIDESFDGAA